MSENQLFPDLSFVPDIEEGHAFKKAMARRNYSQGAAHVAWAWFCVGWHAFEAKPKPTDCEGRCDSCGAIALLDELLATPSRNKPDQGLCAKCRSL